MARAIQVNLSEEQRKAVKEVKSKMGILPLGIREGERYPAPEPWNKADIEKMSPKDLSSLAYAGSGIIYTQYKCTLDTANPDARCVNYTKDGVPRSLKVPTWQGIGDIVQL
ncbi:hypothetical protein [Adhaeribacter rhizoryzae]|uniref:Uncharacterized protein n=1 Tax=Adhaeribacter rhizoryzae TaxID=2607907 RepID=A0A5M6DPP5_9BACT|nr:hypothetical protein [Adhaeribacter rhizoryzae]KAA5548376.1 hypothetical protein F0145_06520 [Adhaeribacter rhizoryzae]